MMRLCIQKRNKGSVLPLMIFIIALLSAVVMGMLQINTEELQVMQNHIQAVEALALAEAGLEDALAQLRTDSSWNAGFSNKSFTTGHYTVSVNGDQITSVATSSKGQTARVQATVTVSDSGSPYVVRVDSIKVNE